MTYEEIAALVFDPFFSFVRLVDLSVLANTETAYQWPDGYTGEKNWDNCAVHPKLLAQVGNVKPTDDELFNGSWADYIAELTATEAARLLELSRISQITDRWNAITDIRGAMSIAGINESNSAILLQRIIDENDIDTLTLLEQKGVEANTAAEFQKRQSKQSAKIALGFSVVALMGAINESKNLTGEQTGAMVMALQSPMALFTSGSTRTAIGYVQAMVLPDGITEADRTAIVAFAQSGLAKIEAQYG